MPGGNVLIELHYTQTTDRHIRAQFRKFFMKIRKYSGGYLNVRRTINNAVTHCWKYLSHCSQEPSRLPLRYVGYAVDTASLNNLRTNNLSSIICYHADSCVRWFRAFPRHSVSIRHRGCYYLRRITRLNPRRFY